jgi:hypothetical protein
MPPRFCIYSVRTHIMCAVGYCYCVLLVCCAAMRKCSARLAPPPKKRKFCARPARERPRRKRSQ